QLDFLRGYVRASANFVYSFGQTQIPDSRSVPQITGGSYYLQSGAPIGMTAGGKVGIKIYEEWYLEAGGYHGVFGQTYPDGLGVVVNIFNAWDFFHPLPAKKVREVPFDQEGGNDDFYKGK